MSKFIQAAEIVEKGWCQGRNARRADGLGTTSNGPLAVQWCMIGAYRKAGASNEECDAFQDAFFRDYGSELGGVGPCPCGG